MTKTLIFFLCIISNLLYSYPNNYQQTIVGSRAAGLGGAGVATSGEGEIAYFNPAGIINTSRDGISISVTNYGMAYMFEKNRSKVGDAINNELKHSSGLLAVPSAASYSWILDNDSEFSRHFFTIDMFVPLRIDLEAESTLNNEAGTYRHHVKNWMYNYIYHVYINYAVRITKRFAVGIAAIGIYSKLYQNDVLYRQDILTPSNSKMSSEIYNIKTVALGMSIGVLLTFERVNLGITLKTKKIRLYSESNYSFIEDNQAPVVYWNLDVNYQRPWELYIGSAVQLIKNKLIFAFDFKLYFAEFQQVVSAPALEIGFERITTWNINVGLEWLINKNWALRGGFFTDRSGTPVLDASVDTDINNIKMDRYGLSIGCGYTSENTKTNLTVSYVWGSGSKKTRRIDDFANFGITSVSSREIVITVGTSYWFDSPIRSKKKKKKTRNIENVRN